jgi:asparagine synthase (glutamine-hydrolysing)
VAQWLNRVGDRLEADESAYACAVTDRLGVSLTVENKPLSQITEASLAELASTLWPTISGADHGRDRDEVARLRDTGSDGIVSGQGGDAVFFQMPSVLVAVDAFRRDGVSVLSSPLLANVARRTGQSVWPVIKAILTDRLRGTPPPIDRSPFLTAAARESVRPEGHPWVRDAAARGAPPAKVLQIQAIANGHLLHGDSRRHREADLLYPLLAQPVVELCLSIAAPDLAGGAFDRPFARAAFASRIPDVIRNRRSKGNLDSFYSRMVAGSLDVLRPLLLDGCLCRAGILDREALDVALHPDRLIWTPRSIEVLWAATVETWAHHWQGQAPDSPRSPRRGP